jgi:hypothetical protein
VVHIDTWASALIYYFGKICGEFDEAKRDIVKLEHCYKR